MNEHEALSAAMDSCNVPQVPSTPSSPDQSFAVDPQAKAPERLDMSQWQIAGNDNFRPSSATIKRLAPAVYRFDHDDRGLFISMVKVVSDKLMILPDTANDRILESMRVFWSKESLYRTHGLLYKRGILLWGPPGSGKTATLQLLSRELIARDGLVIFCDNPGLTSAGLALLRRIEPTRPLIVILEDVDEIINRHGEHNLLALLDGEHQVDNVVMLATTNYPDRLGARIVNRPSRFDERILVDMPSDVARRVYLESLITVRTAEWKNLDRWVNDTKGLSIAHLREMVAAVLCLGQEYSETLVRLRSMAIRPREKEGFGDGDERGFGKQSHQLVGLSRR